MDIEQKIERVNKLKRMIDEIKDFKHQCEIGGQFSETHQKQNHFSELLLSANIWTGSQDPRREKKLSYINGETIKRVATSIISILEEDSEELKVELNKLFN